jgi:threonine aldolase
MTTLIDLRSDTVTRPGAAMREAMMAAPVGDDVFGDDPTVNALQDKLAAMLGFEAALFVPTGTMSNFCAIVSHCQRGEEYIVGQMAHCYRMEGGGAAVFGSVQPQPLDNQPDGTLLLSQIETNIKPDDAHFAITRLLALENTLGGRVLPFDYLVRATALAKSRGLNTHLDGARLFNAAVAQAAALTVVEELASADAGPSQGGDGPLGGQRTARSGERGGNVYEQAKRIAGLFDSVSVCLSKGLGTPAGSVLCGSRALIARAHRVRKMAGGGMRQAGVLAASGIYALDHNVARLAQDHQNARRFAEGLAGLAGLQVEMPQTNIVFVNLEGAARERAADFIAHLKARGILVTGLYKLRFVTHLDVDAAGVDRAVAAIREFFKA